MLRTALLCVLVYLEWLPEKRSEFHVLWGWMLDGLVFARTDGATMIGTRILDKFYSQPAILPGCWKYKCNEMIWCDRIWYMTSCSLIRYDIGICLHRCFRFCHVRNLSHSNISSYTAQLWRYIDYIFHRSRTKLRQLQIFHHILPSLHSHGTIPK